MPCFIRLWTQDGLRPVSYQADSLADAARHEPTDGVYTVTNTYNRHQVLKLDAHLDRLEDSARRAGFLIGIDRVQLRLALRQMIDEAGYYDVRFRITALPHTNDLLLSIEPFVPVAADLITSGVRCITIPDGARNNPSIKATGWMHQRNSIHESLPQGIYAAILLDDKGSLLEGLSSNFYAVLNGELYTAGQGVLAGISRQVVFEVAPGIVSIHTEAVRRGDIPRLEESFITSSSRGIVPVVEIDGNKIGNGKPGKLTMKLREAYLAWVDAHLEAL